MKKLATGIFMILLSSITMAQDPIEWRQEVVKARDGSYIARLIAKPSHGWHIYAQQQPPTAIAQPTEFKFKPNPLLLLMGNVKEEGNMRKHEDREAGITQHEYNDSVAFCQSFRLKSNFKGITFLSGNIKYQLCTDEKCLPPRESYFTFRIDASK